MTNLEMFDSLARYDFDNVKEILDKGYTETSEWKTRLEMLLSSLVALLQDMDLAEEKKNDA